MTELSIHWYMLIEVVLLGLVAGVLGGMLGVGGSVIMIPGLTFMLGRHQHLYQAAAMIVNVAISIPAARRHYKAGATVVTVLKGMLPAALVFVLVGVWLSNLEMFRGKMGGIWLGRVLAVFLVYVIVINVRKLLRPRVAVGVNPGAAGEQIERDGKKAAGAGVVGGIMGTVAGLLGIGGGAIAVPLQQVMLRLPLRSCIANSSAVICISATIGAIYKNASLGPHGYQWQHSLMIAALLAPSAWVGGHLGATLTHRLPLRQVRAAFVALMALAAVKMAAIPWGELF